MAQSMQNQQNIGGMLKMGHIAYNIWNSARPHNSPTSLIIEGQKQRKKYDIGKGAK